MVVLKPLLLVFKFPIYLMIYCGSFRFNLFKPKNFSAHFFFQLSTYFFTSFLASNPFFPLSLSLSLSLSHPSYRQPPPSTLPTTTIHVMAVDNDVVGLLPFPPFPFLFPFTHLLHTKVLKPGPFIEL